MKKENRAFQGSWLIFAVWLILFWPIAVIYLVMKWKR